MQHVYTLKKKERLKSRKLIQQLFHEGKSFTVFPLRILYFYNEAAVNPLQAGFSASSKNFKKAVSRNRIKRLMREAYRLQKNDLQNNLFAQQKKMVVFFIYTHKVLPDYTMVADAMKKAILQLQKSATEKL